MGTRQELHNQLLTLAPHAYHQPPATVRMEYPCFVYNLSDVRTRYADNLAYKHAKAYMLTYISKTSNDAIIDSTMEAFQYCRFNRTYTADNLYHYVFELFY